MGCKRFYIIRILPWQFDHRYSPHFNRNININVESGHTILPSIFEEIMEGDHWRIMSFAGNEVKKNSDL